MSDVNGFKVNDRIVVKSGCTCRKGAAGTVVSLSSVYGNCVEVSYDMPNAYRDTEPHAIHTDYLTIEPINDLDMTRMRIKK